MEKRPNYSIKNRYKYEPCILYRRKVKEIKLDRYGLNKDSLFRFRSAPRSIYPRVNEN